MDKTGAGKLIAEWTVGLMGGAPSPLVVTGVLFILSCGLTQFMSNTASAALLCPIGIAISQNLGADQTASEYSGTRPWRIQIHGLPESWLRSRNRMLHRIPDCYSDGMAVLPRQIIPGRRIKHHMLRHKCLDVLGVRRRHPFLASGTFSPAW